MTASALGQGLSLPNLPLRRSWLVEQLKPSAASKLLKILQAFAPEKAQELRGQPGLRIYGALCAHLKPLLPLYETVFGDWRGVNDVTEEAFYHGVPVNYFGFDESAITYETSYDPSLALIWWLIPEDFDRWDVIDDPQPNTRHSDLPASLKKHAAALQVLSDRMTSQKWTLPPRGRQWKGVWAFLPDVYAYVTHTTGCQLLDFSKNNVYEGDDLPPWDVDEIRGLIQDWKRAAPTWEGIKALVEYVDDDKARLLDLGLALTGNEPTRRELSEPKRGRGGKTLAQIFMGGRHA
jgi:hypothetical protein